MNDWRERLLAEIKRQGFSYRELSLKAGRGPSYVSELLKGKEPRIASLESICDVLGVSTSYILTGTDLTADGERLLRAYTRLGESERDALLKMFRALGASLDEPPERADQRIEAPRSQPQRSRG